MFSSAGDTAINQGKKDMTKKAKFILKCFIANGVYDANNEKDEALAWETLREFGFGFECVDMSDVYGHYRHRFNDTDRNGYEINKI